MNEIDSPRYDLQTPIGDIFVVLPNDIRIVATSHGQADSVKLRGVEYSARIDLERYDDGSWGPVRTQYGNVDYGSIYLVRTDAWSGGRTTERTSSAAARRDVVNAIVTAVNEWVRSNGDKLGLAKRVYLTNQAIRVDRHIADLNEQMDAALNERLELLGALDKIGGPVAAEEVE